MKTKSNIFNGNIFILIVHKINIMFAKIFKGTTNQKTEEIVDKPVAINERIINNILLLKLIGDVNKKGTLENNLKVQKLIFLIQKRYLQQKIKGFSYNFFRWKQGPFSKDVNEDLDLLKKCNLIRWDDDKIYLTKNGQHILSEISEIFKNNSSFAKSFNDVINQFATVSPDTIKEYVYKQSMFVPIIQKVMPIEKVPLKQILLYRPSMKRMKKFFQIDEGWEATIELCLDRDGMVSLERAYEDAKEGRHGKPTGVHTS